MFFPEKMTKVRVLCARKSHDAAVESLYEFGMIHLTPSKALSLGEPLPSFRIFSERLVSLRSLCASLGLSAGTAQPLSSAALQEKWQAAGVEDALTWIRKKNELESTLAALVAEEQRFRPFRNLTLPARYLHSSRIKTLYFQPKATWSPERLKRIAHESVRVEDEGNSYLLLVFDARHADAVIAAVHPHAEAVFDFPQGEDYHLAYERVLIQLENTKASLSATEALIRRYVLRHGRLLAHLLASLEQASKQAEMPLKFGQSAVLSAVEGWVPSRRVGGLEGTLQKRLGSRVVVETLKTPELPPTKLNNPRPIRPFEFLVQALSVPNYHEMDPTLFVFLSFPLFFGMILGDIGYGLVMALIALFIRQKFAAGFFRTLGNLMLLSAFWTVVFGYVFGEFLGGESLLGFPLTPFIHRLEGEGLIHLMQLSLLFGFIQLALGFSIGALVAYRERHFKHAAAKAAWLVFLFSVVGFLSSAAHIEALDIFSPFAGLLGTGWLYVAGLSVVALLLTEGIAAIFELPGLIGNLVSYLRIMALGVVGVVLAGMVNKIPLTFSTDPVGLLSFLVFALAFVAGHAFALVLGIFESSIQSIRLHYVEFFSKFYHGGGIAFNPVRETSEKNGADFR